MVSTNHGRSMYFSSLRQYSSVSTNLRLEIPEGHVITGFAVVQPVRAEMLNIEASRVTRSCPPSLLQRPNDAMGLNKSPSPQEHQRNESLCQDMSLISALILFSSLP